MKKQFMVLGDIDTDIFLKVDHIPTWDEGLLADESNMLPGGKGANTAVQLASLGAPVALMSTIGNDIFGKIGLENIRYSSINNSFISINSNPTTYCVMLLDHTGEKALVVVPSKDIYPPVDMVKKNKEKISEYESVHIIGLNPEKTLAYLEILKDLDVSISVDLDSANGSEEQLLKIINSSDTIFINKQGLHKLIPNAVDDETAVKLLAKKCKNTTLICTLGSMGVMQVSDDGFFYERVDKIEPLDTTGSGDSFVAGWLYVNFCLKSYNTPTKLQFANACGAATALCLGGQGKLLQNPEKDKGVIEFYEPFDAFGYLCNLSFYPFEYEGKIWPTSEQCYQAYKHSDEEYREKIRHCDDIYEVIDMGRNINSGSYDDYRWMNERVEVMYDIVLAKFSQHEDIQKLLLMTGDAKLVEHTENDNFWGDNLDGTGENNLGKVLMRVRDTLKKQKENK